MLRDTGAVIAEEVWQPNHQRIPVRILHKYASEVWQRAGKEAAIDALRSVDVHKYAEFVLKSWLSLPLSFDGLNWLLEREADNATAEPREGAKDKHRSLFGRLNCLIICHY